MKISIVIRSYNEGDHIERLLLGIRAQTVQPFEVILVDSGSTDDTVEVADRYGCRIVRIAKEDFTFGRALNMGCAAASGDVLVFASAHVYPTFDTWLAELTSPFRNDRVVLTYGRQRGGEPNKFSEHQIFRRWFPAESALPQDTYFCNNANCAIRTSAWQQRRYDESLTGLEDLAWAKAAHAEGGLIAYVADAEIVHVHEETWEQVRNRYRREAIAMKAIEQGASFSRLDFLWLLVSNITSDMLTALRQGVLGREFGSILRFRYNQLLGTYLGYNRDKVVSAQLRRRFYYPAALEQRPKKEARLAAHRIDYASLQTHAAVRIVEAPSEAAESEGLAQAPQGGMHKPSRNEEPLKSATVISLLRR